MYLGFSPYILSLSEESSKLMLRAELRALNPSLKRSYKEISDKMNLCTWCHNPNSNPWPCEHKAVCIQIERDIVTGPSCVCVFGSSPIFFLDKSLLNGGISSVSHWPPLHPKTFSGTHLRLSRPGKPGNFFFLITTSMRIQTYAIGSPGKRSNHCDTITTIYYHTHTDNKHITVNQIQKLTRDMPVSAVWCLICREHMCCFPARSQSTLLDTLYMSSSPCRHCLHNLQQIDTSHHLSCSSFQGNVSHLGMHL